MKKNFLLFMIVLFAQINLFSQNGGCPGGPNLIVNGNFEAGYTGFTSEYQKINVSEIIEGQYEIGTIAHHGCFISQDHTTGTGQAMYINGDITTPKKIVWSETINVTPNTIYNFVSWVRAQCYNTSPAILQFFINGVQIGTDFSPTGGFSTTTTWEKFSASWNSGNSTTAVVTIKDYNGAAYGNDFGLDDISFGVAGGGAPVSCSISAVPSNNTFTGGIPTNIYIGYGPQSVTLNITSSGTPTGYTWTGNGSLSCNNCASPVFTPTAPGTYNFSVLVTNAGGCNSTCNITICVLDIRDIAGSGNNPNDKKVFICHVPPGNPGNTQTLSISTNAVPAHLDLHGGDHLGKCDQVPCGTTPLANNSVTSASSTISGATTVDSYNSAVPSGDLLSDKVFKISIFPNPNKGLFTVQLNNLKGARAEITILDAKGAIVEKKNVQLNTNRNNIPFNLSTKLSGMYYMKIVSGGGVYTEKIIIQR